MANPNKDKGTKAETAVVRWLKNNGFPEARRIALSGTLDTGDIAIRDKVMIQVKAGAKAERASDGQILKWLNETEVQCHNGAYLECFLVTKRPGHSVGRAYNWWLHFLQETVEGSTIPMRTTLQYFPVMYREGL